MSDPRSLDGARSLLFEKLVDLDPKTSHDPQALRVMGVEDVKASIKRELERLLDSRRPVGLVEAKADPPQTVMEYGLPDWSTLSPRSVLEKGALERAVRDVIRAYEPRLLNPVVTVQGTPERLGGLTLIVGGEIRLDTMIEPVSFPIDFRNSPRS